MIERRVSSITNCPGLESRLGLIVMYYVDIILYLSVSKHIQLSEQSKYNNPFVCHWPAKNFCLDQKLFMFLKM